MKFSSLLVLILMFLRIFEVSAVTDCNQVTEIPLSECEVLVALYNGTNGPSWNRNTGWNIGNAPCSWYKISCTNDHVSIIDLISNELVGLIPSELGNLSNLKGLYLHGNQLSGSIPSELGNLSNLQWLYLSNNQLSGLIPSELGNLSNLRLLNLRKNQLSGSIPQKLGNLSNLVHVGWADVRKPNIWKHHRPMNVGLRTSAQPTNSPALPSSAW
jgi:Leucine-rich repeat (LRR) protein